MARRVKPQEKQDKDNESLVRVFWRGFFWLPRLVWKALVWISHKPPLKQIGHAFRWFFRLKPIRFIGRILGFNYIHGSWQELKQVTWPGRRDSRRLTTAVIIFSVIFGALVAVVDYGLDKLFKELLLK